MHGQSGNLSEYGSQSKELFAFLGEKTFWVQSGGDFHLFDVSLKISL